MTTPSLPTLATCRLCQGSLRECELDNRLCSICETYAEQMGVRDPKALQAIVAELANEPLFRPTSSH